MSSPFDRTIRLQAGTGKPKVILYPPATSKGLWWAATPHSIGGGKTMGEAIRDLGIEVAKQEVFARRNDNGYRTS